MKTRAQGLSVAGENGARETLNEMRTAGDGRKARLKLTVYIYVTALFLVVMLFILLSYFIHQRSNTAISDLNANNVAATNDQAGPAGQIVPAAD